MSTAPPHGQSFAGYDTENTRIRLSCDARRLYWPLNSDLTSAISVMEEEYHDPNIPLKPYCTEAASGPIWAPVALSPLTEPKTSSLSVSVAVLDSWDESWMEMHENHTECEPSSDPENNPQFGELLDYNPNEDVWDEEGLEHLVRCCGQDRPRGEKASITVNASDEFITVHDFVSTIHPWLIGLRQKILQASGDLEKDVPLPSHTKLMVTWWADPGHLAVVNEDQWIGINSKAGKIIFDREMKALREREAERYQEGLEIEAFKKEQGWD